MRLNHIVALGTVIALATVACGGGSDDAVVPMAGELGFTPDSPPATRAVTLALSGGSTGDQAVIDVQLTDVTSVHTASFTLSYDSSVVRYFDFDTTDSNLDSDGIQIQAIVHENMPGTLTVGLTRLGATGIEFSGTRSLIELRFSRLADAGASPLDFTNTDLLGGAPPQPISNIVWFGGSFQIN